MPRDLMLSIWIWKNGWFKWDRILNWRNNNWCNNVVFEMLLPVVIFCFVLFGLLVCLFFCLLFFYFLFLLLTRTGNWKTQDLQQYSVLYTRWQKNPRWIFGESREFDAPSPIPSFHVLVMNAGDDDSKKNPLSVSRISLTFRRSSRRCCCWGLVKDHRIGKEFLANMIFKDSERIQKSSTEMARYF